MLNLGEHENKTHKLVTVKEFQSPKVKLYQNSSQNSDLYIIRFTKKQKEERKKKKTDLGSQKT